MFLMNGGMFGKLLDVDLSNDKLTDYKFSDENMLKYLGGRGLGAKILLDEFKGGDAFSANNIVIM